MSIDEAVWTLRVSPAHVALVRDAYLGRDVKDSAERFLSSAEFQAVRILLRKYLEGAVVLDVGAGTGIASYAMLAAGATTVIALEPDPSDEVGRGAIARLSAGTRLRIIDAWGEKSGLPSSSVDIVYTRQALHHSADLDQMLAESARVLRPGGVLLACREHVVDNAEQLRAFLAAHPVHQLAGGENAFSLDAYLHAIEAAGLVVKRVLGPWDSVINAFPVARTDTELANLPRLMLEQRFGRIGRLAGSIPVIRRAVWARLRRPRPGRMYTFLATKPPI
jgi:ubiquinone/menaquinone biosynthesis C-methylase UbiE